MEDSSHLQSLDPLISLTRLTETYNQQIKSWVNFKFQTSRCLLRLNCLRECLEYQTATPEDLNKITQTIDKLLSFSHEFLTPLSEWFDQDKFSEIIETFSTVRREMKTFASRPDFISPLTIINDPWIDCTDFYFDSQEVMHIISSEPLRFNHIDLKPPAPPKIRQLSSDRLIFLNDIYPLHDFENDEEIDTSQLPEYISGRFGLIGHAPVHIKIIRCESESSVLNLAYNFMSIPRSDYLHRTLAVCTETNNLQSYHDGGLHDFNIPKSCCLVSVLAPFGSLKSFLSQPPEDILIHQQTYEPLSKSCGGAIAPDIKISILLDICTALNFLHTNGCLHGRLHYNNVLVYPGYRAKLCDGGCSSLLSSNSSTKRYVCNKSNEIEIIQEKKVIYRHNRTGDDIRWYAPEIVLKDILDMKKGGNRRLGAALGTTASDIYGFGMLIFSVATEGCCPFFNLMWEEAVVNALFRGERPTFPSHIPFRVPLEPLINEDNGGAIRCWAENPFDRPRLQDLEGELKSILIELLSEKEIRLKTKTEGEIAKLHESVQEKQIKYEQATKRIAEGKEIIRTKEEEKNAKVLASEKRQVQVIIDKARPRLEGWIKENELLKSEINSVEGDIVRLKTILKDSESRLVGGKAFILRHRTWNNDFNIGNMISRYARNEDKEWLTFTCSNKCAVESLVYDLNRPLDSLDEIGLALEHIITSFHPVESFLPLVEEKNPFIVTIEVSHIFNGFKSIVPVLSMSRAVSNSSDSQPTKRRISLNQFYQNETLRNPSFLSRTTTGSSIQSKDFDHDRWECDAMGSFEKGLEDYLILPRCTEYNQFTEDLSDCINFSEIVECDDDFVLDDSLEFQYLAALRGEISSSRKLYKTKSGYGRDQILEIISLLKSETTQDQVTSDWSSPCHLAASLGHLSILTCLIESLSYLPDQLDHMGNTPLLMACRYGHVHIVRYLVERHEVNVNQEDMHGMTPILMAAWMGHVNLLTYLHSQQKDQGKENYFYAHQTLGGSILHWACLCGSATQITQSYYFLDSRSLETVQYILSEIGCPVDIRCQSDFSTPLLWAAASSPPTKTKLKIIELLLTFKADMNALDNQGRQFQIYINFSGRNILFLAVLAKDIQLVKILVDQFKISLGTKDSSGKTVLQVANGECETYLKGKLKGKRLLFSSG